MPEKKWKLFEKLVAAINKVKVKGAEVRWNEKINGRQFDVTIRFRLGDLYEHLVVIECRDEKGRIEAEAMDAFVTKSRDAGANKGIMVSAAGFQSGAIAVAEKHGVDLFTLTEIQELPQEFWTGHLIPALQVSDLTFGIRGGGQWTLPTRPNEAQYFVNATRVWIGTKTLSLSQVLESYCRTSIKPSTEIQHAVFEFPIGTAVIRPDTRETVVVSELAFNYQIIQARVAFDPGGADPQVFSTAYRLRNEKTGDATTTHALVLEPGFDTQLAPDALYRDPATNFAYICEYLDGELAGMFLIEGYQHGEAIQGAFKMLIAHASKYVEITDPLEIERLMKVYKTNEVHQRVRRERSGS
jgi:Restriction endonuclease